MIPRRILIYGVTGSGKSTLAQKLSCVTGLPLYLVDEYCHLPGWIDVPAEQQRRRFEAICAQPEWILDSAYGSWLEVPVQRAELIIALDYPRWLSLGRLLRRSIHRAWTQQPVCNGNYESFARMFCSNSILLWHFQSFDRKRRRMRRWHRERPQEVVRFTRPRQTDAFVASLEATLRGLPGASHRDAVPVAVGSHLP
jgi:adenylate kinase family enzyme